MKKNSVLFAIGITTAPIHGAAVWVGNSNGVTNGSSPISGGDGNSLFMEANWDDDQVAGTQAVTNNTINPSTGSPAGLALTITVNNSGVAGGPNGAGSPTSHLRTNGYSITVAGAGSGIKLATGARIENDGTSGGSRSTATVGSGGFITTSAFQDVAVSVSGSASSIFFIGTGTGLSGNNATINLAGINADSSSLNWTNISSANLFVAGVLGSITVNGTTGVWGSDPLVYEPGDNLLATAQSYTYAGNGALPQNIAGSTSGYRIVAVPEPEAAWLGLLGFGLLLRGRSR